MSYYYISAHGRILSDRFIPKKGQTVVFFSLPGNPSFADASLDTIFNINVLKKPCINPEKKRKYNEKIEDCSNRQLSDCKLSHDCEVVSFKKKSGKMKCVPNIKYSKYPLELLSEEYNLQDRCNKNYICEFCDTLREKYNYDIRIWDHDRIQKSGKGIPNLSVAFSPLDNYSKFLKYGVYKVPNKSLDFFYNKFKGVSPTINRVKELLGYSSEDDIHSEPLRQKLIDECFRGSIPTIFKDRNNLLDGPTILLSKLLEELPKGIYFVISCRSSEYTQIIHPRVNNLYIRNIYNNIDISTRIKWKVNEMVYNLVVSDGNSGLLYTIPNNNINHFKIYDESFKNYRIEQLSYVSKNVAKYKLGDDLETAKGRGKVIKIEANDILSGEGPGEGPGTIIVEVKIFIETSQLIEFMKKYSYMREYYNLIRYHVPYQNQIEKQYTTILVLTDISNNKTNWMNVRVIDFIPNISNILEPPQQNNRINYYKSNLFLYENNNLIFGMNYYDKYRLIRIDINELYDKMYIDKYVTGKILDENSNTSKWKYFIGENNPLITKYTSPEQVVDIIANKTDCVEKYRYIFISNDINGEFIKECMVDNELSLHLREIFLDNIDNIFGDNPTPNDKNTIDLDIKQINKVLYNIAKGDSKIHVTKLSSFIPFYKIYSPDIYNLQQPDKLRNEKYVDLLSYPFLYEDELIPHDVRDYFDIYGSTTHKINSLNEFIKEPHFRNNSRLAIFCNEKDVFINIDNPNNSTEKYLIKEWTEFHKYKNYCDKALIGTVIDYWFFKIDKTGEVINIQELISTMKRPSNLITFIRLPFDKLEMGKKIWIKDKTVKTYLRSPHDFYEKTIIDTKIYNIPKTNYIMLSLTLLDNIVKTKTEFNPNFSNFLFEDEIHNRYPQPIQLIRQDSISKNITKPLDSPLYERKSRHF